MFQIALVVLFVMSAVYGAHIVWVWASQSKTRIGGMVAGGIGMLLVAVPDQATFAQSGLSVDIDLQPFFDSLNSFLPAAIGLFAAVGGIIGALSLARMIIGMVVKAFASGSF